MEKIVNIRLKLPSELNFNLEVHLAKLRREGVKTTKESLILKLAQIGLLNEKIS